MHQTNTSSRRRSARVGWRAVALGWLSLSLAACGAPTTPTGTRPDADESASIPFTATAVALPTPDAGAHTTRPLLMAHYMAWYQTPLVSGAWGWHWTMNHYNPNKVDASGRAEIASQFYPLTGPYDSRDAAVLDYQVALMKLSGIDGVIVDWYGQEPLNDYGLINSATHKLFEAVQRAGLLFAICYEDRAIGQRVNGGDITPSRGRELGRDTLAYLQKEWFTSSNYLRHDGRPVLFVFGNPPHFDTSADWDAVFADLEVRPWLVTEDSPRSEQEPSSYPWPPMGRSIDGVLSPESLDAYLTDSYARAGAYSYRVAGAFPGFHDIYKEAGVSESYGRLDAADGDTLRHTLDLALASDPDVVQLITWNDYGEGTMLEPTRETGYTYLEIIQAARRASIEPGFAFTADDLRLPERLLALRRDRAALRFAPDLDAAFAALVAGDAALARSILDAVEQRLAP